MASSDSQSTRQLLSQFAEQTNELCVLCSKLRVASGNEFDSLQQDINEKRYGSYHELFMKAYGMAIKYDNDRVQQRKDEAAKAVTKEFKEDQ